MRLELVRQLTGDILTIFCGIVAAFVVSRLLGMVWNGSQQFVFFTLLGVWVPTGVSAAIRAVSYGKDTPLSVFIAWLAVFSIGLAVIILFGEIAKLLWSPLRMLTDLVGGIAWVYCIVIVVREKVEVIRASSRRENGI